MFLRVTISCFIFIYTLSCFAQSPPVLTNQAKATPVVHHTVGIITPPINSIVAPPKEVSKKKRKSVPVTVAQKQKPAAKNIAK